MCSDKKSRSHLVTKFGVRSVSLEIEELKLLDRNVYHTETRCRWEILARPSVSQSPPCLLYKYHTPWMIFFTLGSNVQLNKIFIQHIKSSVYKRMLYQKQLQLMGLFTSLHYIHNENQHFIVTGFYGSHFYRQFYLNFLYWKSGYYLSKWRIPCWHFKGGMYTMIWTTQLTQFLWKSGVFICKGLVTIERLQIWRQMCHGRSHGLSRWRRTVQIWNVLNWK